MAGETKRADVLQFIYSFFLGLLIVVFIGVGVWTFYPEPFQRQREEQREIDRLYRQMGNIQGKDGTTTPAEQARIEELQRKIDALNDKMQGSRDQWAVNTSIILLGFATLLMAISLLLPEHMKVFSNGVLLGGVFSVIYGTGWSFAGGDSRARFFVVAVALALSVAIGYLRFVRERKDKAAAVAETSEGGEATVAATPAFAELTSRVEELERRTSAAAVALGAHGDRGD